ncbi:hypothetical protein DVH24_033506 [Malus domestica]|uniref:Uncharacterized protein n=1 Tax=Malus domestica TaxID=3750 RepID=A0A498JAW7_MALDO|nr:hypothetical protein DVH24_033506 [Malus domestica]
MEVDLKPSSRRPVRPADPKSNRFFAVWSSKSLSVFHGGPQGRAGRCVSRSDISRHPREEVTKLTESFDKDRNLGLNL